MRRTVPGSSRHTPIPAPPLVTASGYVARSAGRTDASIRREKACRSSRGDTIRRRAEAASTVWPASSPTGYAAT